MSVAAMSIVEVFGVVTLVALTAAVLLFVTALLRDPHAAGAEGPERDGDADPSELDGPMSTRS